MDDGDGRSRGAPAGYRPRFASPAAVAALVVVVSGLSMFVLPSREGDDAPGGGRGER